MALEIVLATSNENKVRELNEIAREFDVEFILPQLPFDPVENGNTFDENAYSKALCALNSNTSGKKLFLADDSGLCVDYLKGAPGLYSARYAKTNDERIARVLSELKKTTKRGAKFVCALVLCDDTGKILHKTQGICKGKIGYEPVGKNGFGYDPIFLVDGFLGKSMAQLTPEEKNFVSHRAKALMDMLVFVKLKFTAGSRL